MRELESQIQVDPSHYQNLSYDSKERWISYWHQIDEVLKLKPENALEIGIGNGVVSRYLKNSGLDLTTMDIDERLNPDTVGSILDIPFEDNSFDVAACFEVLEHIPYSDFPKALKELKRVARKHVLLSVPDVKRVYKIYVHLPREMDIKGMIPVPRLRKLEHNFNGQHYWEIGKKGYPLKRIIGDMENSGLKLLHTYRVFEFKSHRFFILEIQ